MMMKTDPISVYSNVCVESERHNRTVDVPPVNLLNVNTVSHLIASFPILFAKAKEKKNDEELLRKDNLV